MAEVIGLPAGMKVQLSRATVLAGASDQANRWMAMLRDRHAECVATLDRERMAVEVIFRTCEGGTDYLWWFTLAGSEGATVDDSPFAIDADHAAHARRTKEPGWLEAEPQLVLLPQPVEQALTAWAVRR
ncbi:MAG: hypothetical protein H0T66_12690 [Geodermatophilaceae bacterium]|nr:hypothetical protein [Geodermatophilaceae bacterium]MDQ3455967.1 DUF6176 family protein [Actinomycetota bacterium]